MPALPAMILCGGLSSRMGGTPKPLAPLGNGTILSSIIARLSPQAVPLAINANGDAAPYAAFGLPVLADDVAGHPGPMAGVLVALAWAARLGAEAVLTVAGDTPFLPGDLAARLADEASRFPDAIIVAASGERTHPVFALWPAGASGRLRRALVEEDIRRVTTAQEAAGRRLVLFPPIRTPEGPLDPFFNVNTPDDLARAEQMRLSIAP